MEWKRFCTYILRLVGDTLFPLPPKLETLARLSSEDMLHKAKRASSDGVLSAVNGEAVFAYRDPLVRDSLRAFKYSSLRELGNVFAETLYDMLYEDVMYDSPLSTDRHVFVLPIPLSHTRLHERGFNQSEIIARHFVELCNDERIILDTTTLIRVRNTEKQALRASRAEREENIRGCFALTHPEKVSHKRVLLIDDVITTGATMREARQTLLDAGAREVRCVAVAH